MTHWFAEEAAFLGGPANEGPGYAVVRLNKDPPGTGKLVVFRSGPGSLPDAQAYVEQQGDRVTKDYYIVESPSLTTSPMPPQGPYRIVGGGTLALMGNRWVTSGGGGITIGLKPILIAGVLGGIGAGIILLATHRRRK